MDLKVNNKRGRGIRKTEVYITIRIPVAFMQVE